MQYKKKLRDYSALEFNQTKEELKEYFKENDYRIVARDKCWVPVKELYIDFIKTLNTERLPSQDQFTTAIKFNAFDIERNVELKTKLIKDSDGKKKQIKVLTNITKMD